MSYKIRFSTGGRKGGTIDRSFLDSARWCSQEPASRVTSPFLTGGNSLKTCCEAGGMFFEDDLSIAGLD